VSIRDGHPLVVCRLCVEAAVDLLSGGAVQIPHLQAETGGLDEGVGEGVDADVVSLALGGLDVVAAVRLDIAHRDEVTELVGMRLHPGAGQELHRSADVSAKRACTHSYFDVGDDGHGLVHVVERLQQDVGRSAVHVLHRVGELAHEVEGALGKVDPNVARVANVVEHVAHGVEAGFLIAKLVGVAGADQRLKVGEGNGWRGSVVTIGAARAALTPPSTVAVAAAGAEVGVFGR
jgi:hypothetical protein